jgi:hypothetical protein
MHHSSQPQATPDDRPEPAAVAMMIVAIMIDNHLILSL